MLTPSRRATALALHAVFGEGRRVPEGWDRGLSPEDAAFSRAMLGHTLRSWGRLQAWFESKLRDPRRGAPLGSRIAAALGAAQLAWLPGVSSHAAVHESVELVGDRELGFPPHRGLMNAILRSASKDRLSLEAEFAALPPDLDLTPFARRVVGSALSQHKQPEKFQDLWNRLRSQPSPSFRRIDMETPLPSGLEDDLRFPGALKLDSEAPFPRTWLMDGKGMVQDLSSQALMAFEWSKEPHAILDACAAPGGKTTALALKYPEASITALEQDARRTDRLRQNLESRGVKAHLVTVEAAKWMETTDQMFDLILLDAPCTGSGTLQKHPELIWTGDSLDVDRLVSVQARLIEASISRIAPGGLLIYAVCSWLSQEGADHFHALVHTHPELTPAPVWPSSFGTGSAPTSLFLPNPLSWAGEGFQAFAVQKNH